MFRCPEILFNPALLGMEAEGIDSLVYTSTQKCDIDLRRSLLTNLVVSGMSFILKSL
jgi:actin